MRYHLLEGLDVLDPDTMVPVARDAASLGEVMFRGNVVMKGYLKNKAASDRAFAGGWFHSGDLGVMHADGYIQLKDRSKDIIISGGENISSIEVEDALYKHAAVRPPRWWRSRTRNGARRRRLVELKPGQTATAEELIAWCRQNLAGYKVPRTIVFAEIPKTLDGEDPEVQAAGAGEECVGWQGREATCPPCRAAAPSLPPRGRGGMVGVLRSAHLTQHRSAS